MFALLALAVPTALASDTGGAEYGVTAKEPKAKSSGLRGARPSERRILGRIARCESGGNPRAVSATGLYRGKYQFSRETWKRLGGRGSDPARASESHQDQIALKLLRREGTAPWPSCSRA